jgi:hypothetical protein
LTSLGDSAGAQEGVFVLQAGWSGGDGHVENR